MGREERSEGIVEVFCEIGRILKDSIATVVGPFVVNMKIREGSFLLKRFEAFSFFQCSQLN